ncbi:mariner transposase [Trichonephila clavipes]|uniref:Mariner transposase n=1 Tax=Trichonephila clavipes TaxID=2585209 RepID=A0A8X6SND5_TRICX|nr:mariner transposase [Trichonephila clavipes]
MKHRLVYNILNQKRSSAEWTAAGESRPKRPKSQMSSDKAMVYVFWNAHGILFDYFEKGKTLKGAIVSTEGKNKDNTSSNRKEKKVLFHQDNASCHKSMKRMIKLNELLFELLYHPPYSADLAPSNYWLFSEPKRRIQGKWFFL